MRYTRFRFALAGLLFACAAGAQDKLPKAKDFDAPTAAPGDRTEDVRRELAGRSPEQQLAVLERLAAEWAAHKGTCAAAGLAFEVRLAELGDANRRLADAPAPSAFVGPVRAPADLDAATAATKARADFFAPRVKELEALVARAADATAARADAVRAFDAAAAHLALLRAARDFAKVPADKQPALAKPAGLKEAEELIDGLRKGHARNAVALDKVAQLFETHLAGARSALAAETAALAERTATRDATLAALAFEKGLGEMAAGPLADELGRARTALAEKRTALAGDAADYAKAVSAAADARARRAAAADPPVPTAHDLAAAHAFLTARLRASDERAERGTALVAALDEQEKRGLAYAATLADARRAAQKLAACVAELGARAGRGELKADQPPVALARAATEVAEASQLAATATTLQKALAELRAEREATRKPDAETEAARTLTASVRARVAERLELQAEAKRFAAEHAVEAKDRSPSDQKRLERRAAEFRARDRDPAEPFLELDRSALAAERAALLDAYYRELADLAERQDALAAQQDRLAQLAELPRKEADDIAKLRAVIAKRAEPWDAWLAARAAPTGLAAEASGYLDERARLDAVAAIRARRVAALTGSADAQQSALGGAIGDARRELNAARTRGLIVLGTKLVAVFVGALFLSVLLARALKRALRGANPSPVLGPVRRAVRWLVRFAALAVALNVLGFDVTAGVVGAAILVLAFALAARSVIADALAAVAICADGRFAVGDVVRLNGGEPARVVGLTWRSTALKNANGLTVSVPNRKLTEGPIENLSRGAETYDALTVTVSTDKDAGKVIGVIRAALQQCKSLSADQGVSVVTYAHKGLVKVVQYRFWWYLKDFDSRNKARDEVFARIALGLANEDMTGIEVALA